MKIAVIARCKNEIDFLEKWIDNKKFCDLFLITDNDSSDGSYEYLSKRKNVIVTRVSGFDEGRDFQILLDMARINKVDWVFKFDCDEFVEDNFISQFKYILKHTDFDCIRLRKVSIHYTITNNKCSITRDYLNPGIYGVKLTPDTQIRDERIHVGSFYFYKKAIVLSPLVSHFWIRSEIDAIQRAKLYSSLDLSGKIHKIKNEISSDKLIDIELARTNKIKNYYDFGDPFLFEKENSFKIIPPKFNKSFFRSIVKKIFWSTFLFFGMSQLYLNLTRRNKS